MSGTVVRIVLPLPVDVAGGVLHGIGSVYPDTVIRTDGPAGYLTLELGDRGVEHVEPQDSAAVQGAVEESDAGDFGMELTSVGANGFGFSAAQAPVDALVFWARAVLDDMGADNYVELDLHDDSTSPSTVYTVTIVRPGGKTPHRMRMEAQERVELLEARLRAAGVDPDSV